MRSLALFAVAATLLLPLAASAPACQAGVQTVPPPFAGYPPIPVQGGTPYVLTGGIADFDIFFLDAAGRVVGHGIACGTDSGTVPATAVSAHVRMTSTFQLPGCGPSVATSAAAWVYCDGL